MKAKKRAELNIMLCKENFKNKLKDRHRVRGYCFSNNKYKKEFDSLNARKLKKEINQDHFTYNEKLKNLIKNFKSIKNDIISIEQRDKEMKRIKNQPLLLEDKNIMSFDKLYEKIYKVYKQFQRAKNKKNKYYLIKSKINSQNKNNDIDDEYNENEYNNIKNINYNSNYNSLETNNTDKNLKEEKNKNNNLYNNIFNNKRIHSAKIIKSKNEDKNIFNNLLNIANEEREIRKTKDLLYKLIKKNHNFDESYNIYSSENDNSKEHYKSNFINEEKKYKLNSNRNSNKNFNIKKRIIKNKINGSNYNNNKNFSRHISTEFNLNTNNIYFSSFNKNKNKSNKRNNLFLKTFKNIDKNNKKYSLYNSKKNIFNQTEGSNKNDFNLNKKYSFNNIKASSRMTTITKTNNKSTNYNTISNFININKNNKNRLKSCKVKYMPLYTAKITDFVNNYNRIKNTNKVTKLKRKENHWSTYADIEKDFNIKEEMMMFLLKDKYINSQFPQKRVKKPNQRKLFVKNLTEKLEILENPFNLETENEI